MAVSIVLVPFVTSQTTGRQIVRYVHTLPENPLTDSQIGQRQNKTLEKLALHKVSHSILSQS